MKHLILIIWLILILGAIIYWIMPEEEMPPQQSTLRILLGDKYSQLPK